MGIGILSLIVSYLIGSIPFGLVFSKIAGYGDIRNIGSGNIGTTNVLRTGNKPLALLTLLADSGKIIVAIMIAHKINFHQDYLVAFFGLIGHLFPTWLGFKGGKGVASFFGLSLYLFTKIALGALLIWIFVFYLFRFSSLAAIISLIFTFFCIIVINPIDFNLFLTIIMILIILVKHKDNLGRLLKGEEAKFSKF